jgi:hypothetical protein
MMPQSSGTAGGQRMVAPSLLSVPNSSLNTSYLKTLGGHLEVLFAGVRLVSWKLSRDLPHDSWVTIVLELKATEAFNTLETYRLARCSFLKEGA